MFAHAAERGLARATVWFLCPGVYGFRLLNTNKSKRTCLVSLVFFGYLKPVRVRVCVEMNPLVIKEINRLRNVGQHGSVESYLRDRLTWSSGLATSAAGRENMEGTNKFSFYPVM